MGANHVDSEQAPQRPGSAGPGRDAQDAPASTDLATTLSGHDPPVRARPARRLRRRRVPGRARADDHRRRAAVDPRGPRRPGEGHRLDRAAQGVVDHQRLPAGLHPHDAAGRPDDRPVGRPPAVHGRVVDLHRRLRAGRAVAVDGPAHRGTAGPGGRRRRARAGRDGRRRAPVRRCGPAAGPRRHRGADVPRDGRRAVRGRDDPRLRACGGCDRGHEPRAVPRSGLALGLLHQRPDRAGRAAPGLGRVGGLGHAAAGREAGPPRSRVVRAGACSSGSSG